MKIVVIAKSDSGKILGIYEDTKSAEELAKMNGGHIEYYPCYLNSEDRKEHLGSYNGIRHFRIYMER